MCIRDRDDLDKGKAGSPLDGDEGIGRAALKPGEMLQVGMDEAEGRRLCLLYTSDAADEEDSVDFVGLRNIKKKKKKLFFFFFKQKTAYEM